MSRLSDIASRLQAISNAEKETSGNLNPKVFESDIVAALNQEQGLASYQSGLAKSVAQMCANDMIAKFGKISEAKVISNLKGSGGAVLSPLYKRFMCAEGARCNGDPKCDILAVSQMGGRMQISLKKEGGAQVASASAGEINAVLSAALGKDRKFVSIVREIISSTLDKNKYYEIRAKYAQDTKGSPEDFDAMLSNTIGMKSKAFAPSTKDISEFNRFLKSIGVQEKITAELREYLAASSSRKAIFKEFASGENRYTKSESIRSADWFMTWNERGKIEAQEIEEFVNSHLGSFRMNIRDRGNQLGGSLRIDIRESAEFVELEKQLHADFDHYCLTEGVLDTTVNILRTAGKSVADLYRQFVSAIKSLLSFVAALFASGVGTVLEYFGLEATEMSYTW